MIWRSVAWTLLIIHFCVHEPFREQLLAAETVICCLCSNLTPVHIVSFFVIVIYFVQTSYEWIWWAQCIHHAVVLICIFGEYVIKEWHCWTWVLLCWSIRWLSSIGMYYQHPLRSSLRCVIFGLVAQKRFAPTFKDGFKWSWILLVHEVVLFVLPLQMLYEVYKYKKTEMQSSV